MSQSVFPIKSSTACLLKWSWSTIFLRQGTSSSCHRTDQRPIPVDNLASFHNLPNKVQARQMMRRGEWPQEGCQYCEKIESAGGTSDRQYQLLQHNAQDQIPPELLIDPDANEVTPTVLEIYFNNTCNMACLYCGSHFSSKWEEENRRFGVYNQNPQVTFGYNPTHNQHYERMLADFWTYLKENNRYKHIRQYQIAGGEPFFQPEFDTSIDFWSQHPNPDLTFNMITNLKVPHKKFCSYIDRFGEMVADGYIKKIQISASLDAWGPQEEYVRWGLDLAEWTENFEYLLDKPFVVKCINSAISGLTIKTMPDLIKNINAWNDQTDPYNPINFSFMSVMSPSQMSPDIFGSGVFEDDFTAILAEMREVNDTQKNAKLHMAGIGQQISHATRDIIMIQGLKDYLTEIDRRRNTDWTLLFPWLVEI